MNHELRIVMSGWILKAWQFLMFQLAVLLMDWFCAFSTFANNYMRNDGLSFQFFPEKTSIYCMYLLKNRKTWLLINKKLYNDRLQCVHHSIHVTGKDKIYCMATRRATFAANSSLRTSSVNLSRKNGREEIVATKFKETVGLHAFESSP